MTETERQLHVVENESSRDRHARIDRLLENLEERVKTIESWRQWAIGLSIGLCTAFSFSGAFIGFLIKTYVFPSPK